MGLVISIFSFSALIARPFSGWVTDNLGRKWAMIGGCIFCIIAGCLYPFATTVSFFLLIRLVHGFSTGFTPTGFTAFTSDTIVANHRGRAMGWQGMFNNIGTSIGYALGAFIISAWGQNYLFICSAIFAIVALFLFSLLPETIPPEIKGKTKIGLDSLFYLPAWKPGLLMALVCVSLGSILTIMPDYTKSLGFSNAGLFLSIYITFSLLFRLVSGKISDALGRSWSTAIGTLSQCISMGLLIWGHTHFTFYISAFFYGIGQGFNAPSLFAWAGDTADSKHRGRALASLFMTLELGIILGGYFGGKIIYAWKLPYSVVFEFNGICFVFAFLLSLMWTINSRKTH